MKQHLNGINTLFFKPLVATLILAGYIAGLFNGSLSTKYPPKTLGSLAASP